MRYRDKKRLSLKLFLFCFLYTTAILFIIYYSGNKNTMVTTNITNVKSIESYRIKDKEENNNIGTLDYLNQQEYNCLNDHSKIINNKYNDNEYGEVLILKTNDNYLCYSIIKVSTNDNQYFYGIVLDRDKNQQDNNFKVLINNNLNNIFNNQNIIYKIERIGN